MACTMAPDHMLKLWRRCMKSLPRDLAYLPDQAVDESLKCPVCLCWMVEPVQLGCNAGHHMCRRCAGALAPRACPLDRQPFTEYSEADSSIRDVLDALLVQCPFSAAGCPWTGSRGTLLEHCHYSCEQALEECRSCGAHVRRQERGAHVHGFEVGCRVLDVVSGERGEVVHADLLSDKAFVRFPSGSRACVRSELLQVDVPSAFPDQLCKKQAKIDSVLDLHEKAEKLNVCFLVDCTGSMSGHIRAIKNQIFRIVREMTLRFPSMNLHLAFVGYRDHSDGDARIETLPFTTSVADFRDFVGARRAFGGGDTPEDVLGGLKAALELPWGVGGAATRVLLHIADAPCHGHQYHDRDGSATGHRFCCSDNYPQGDPLGLESAPLLQGLKDHDVQYIFGRINHSTDRMIQVFDSEAGGSYIQQREMRDTSLVAQTVTTSLHASVSATVSTLSACARVEPVRTCDEVPIWRDIEKEDVEVFRHRQFTSLEELRTDSCGLESFSAEQAVVQLAPMPFSQGETRTAHYALLDGSAAVAKRMKHAVDTEDAEAEDGCDLEEMLALSEVSAVAAFLAEKFSELHEGPGIRVLQSHVGRGSFCFNVEDALPAAEFRRYSNNIGWWEPDADELLMRFMRWTHEATGGYLMVTDLQGVRDDSGFLLTDPCILCQDVCRFGSGNLGPRALNRCLQSLVVRLDNPPELVAEEDTVIHSPSLPHVSSAPAVVLPPHEPTRLAWSPDLHAPPGPAVEEAAPALPRASSVVFDALAKAGARRAPSKLPAIVNPQVEDLNVEDVIGKLLLPARQVRSASVPSQAQLTSLLKEARSVLLTQPSMLELDGSVNILGDVHGQYADLLRFFDLVSPAESNFLLLGDYVDRGKQSLEVMILLIALKVHRPENFFLLRGNHECASITRIYGFYDECKRRLNIKMWKQFCDVFNCLPWAATVESKIFCCHGGLSPELSHLDAVRRISRPSDIPDSGLACDLLWADPDSDISGWAENDRGVSYRFGADVVANFLEKNDMDLVIRAHQVVEDGYEFFGGKRLVTLFSAPRYVGEFDNKAALLSVAEDLECSFKIIT